MLSDKEKKAIDDLFVLTHINGYKDLCTQREVKIYTLDLLRWQNGVKVLLKLIEKQSKEIEELKKPKYIINCKTNEITKLTNDFVSKDKIKEKIEELEKEQEDNRKVLYNAVNNLFFKEIEKISNRIIVNMSIRDILKSILSKEE